jgi:hypothetical protein
MANHNKIYANTFAGYNKAYNYFFSSYYIYKKHLANCLNCGASISGKYCSACGQKIVQERYSVSMLVHEVVHFFTHFEKGFLNTIWGFISRPGITSLNLIKGKRKNYQSPVSYLFICTGLYILVHNFIINEYHYHVAGDDKATLLEDQANILLRTNFSPFILFILMASAVVVYFVLAKPKLNFIEVTILCLYGGGTYLAMLLISDMVLGLLFKINILSPGVFMWQTILSSVYNFWFSYDVFSQVRIKNLWSRLLLTALLIAGIGYVLFIYLPVAWLLLFH